MGASNHKMERLDRASRTGVLSLEDMKLKDVPKEIKTKLDAGRLRTFSVAGNTIERLPDWITSFVALKTLDLGRNNLSVLMDLSPLTKLETLSLRRNRLTTVHPSIFELRSLKKLDLSSNKLAGVPPEGFGRLRKLWVLDLSENRLQALPADCGSLGVEELNLNGNLLSEISADLAKASSLRVLRIERNKIEMAAFPPVLLTESSINLIAFDGNPMTTRQFQAIEGYGKYEARFTASKKKMGT